MKKPLLILFALGAGLSSAGAGPFELPLFDWLSPTPDRPAAGSERRARSPEAVCKEVDVPVDEGYGVSRRERRVVCDQER
jgi:hypothetical protein